MFLDFRVWHVRYPPQSQPPEPIESQWFQVEFTYFPQAHSLELNYNYSFIFEACHSDALQTANKWQK